MTSISRHLILFAGVCLTGCFSRGGELEGMAVVACNTSEFYGRVVESNPQNSLQGRLIDQFSFSDVLPRSDSSNFLTFGEGCLIPFNEFRSVDGGLSLAIDCDGYQANMNFNNRGVVELTVLPAEISDPPQVSVGRFVGSRQFIFAEFPGPDRHSWGRYLFGIHGDDISIFGTNSDCSYTRADANSSSGPG